MASDGPPAFIIVFFSFVGTIMLFTILFSALKTICKDPPPETRSRRVAAVRTPASSAAPVTNAPSRDAGMPRAADGGPGTAALELLPEFTYSPAAQKKKLNCSVCLMDLREGERGRFLPSCFHCFHVECIDAWLAAHSECPVCRASIFPEAPELAV